MASESTFTYRMIIITRNEVTPHITGAILQKQLRDYWEKHGLDIKIELLDYHGKPVEALEVKN